MTVQCDRHSLIEVSFQQQENDRLNPTALANENVNMIQEKLPAWIVQVMST